jgi:N-methylhydantoinase A/oxoprolinase/acetone carboxylase beta subunit
MLHLAVDVGGTFTDICLFDDQEGATRVAKVSSTRDPIDAVFEGIGEMDVALGEISLFSHGTTVATNVLITREFPRAAMVTTRGFRDVIEIRRHGVILDWGTGELLPKTTEGFRTMLERRVVPHWKNGPQESRGA